ncbi:MAG: D-lyxose/D-mannose family sugar isomerase [Planctomycetota bacterium]
MLDRAQVLDARTRAAQKLAEAQVILSAAERERIEVADFGLGMLAQIGLQLFVYVNTARVCAKELVLFPGQICPEHLHPDVAGEPGKEETFRCRAGEVYLYVPGARTANPRARLPPGKESTFTVWHEIVLLPGDQHTLVPNTRHWFQAGPAGAIVTEFATRSRDETDRFTDPAIVRVPRLVD